MYKVAETLGIGVVAVYLAAVANETPVISTNRSKIAGVTCSISNDRAVISY